MIPIRRLSKVIIGLTLVCNTIFSQTIVKSNGYQTDFEDEAERNNAAWHLNTGNRGPVCANKWYFGKPGANGGENGLFISGDNGVTNSYVESPVSVVAYRSITLDEGDYELTFDWQAGGLAEVDGLYVCWVPEKDTAKLKSVNNSFLQDFVVDTISSYTLFFGQESSCLAQRNWNTIVDTIHSDGTPYNLVFVWRNGLAKVESPSASIDNILITEVGTCHRPTDLMANAKGDDVVFQWSGDAESYDVKCWSEATGEWQEFKDVTGNYLVISGIPEGISTYYIRANCGEFTSGWVSLDKFLFYPGMRCINYLGLTNSNCWIGDVSNPKQKRVVVDNGSWNKNSRHTIHWNHKEHDSRTNGMLKTVPDGELASVRLGNWGTGAEAECVEYLHTVDTTTSAILLLNYAVVFQDPDHDSIEQPRFTLEILYEDKPLDSYGCGEAFFAAGKNTTGEGWNCIQNTEGGNAIWWKDWTTVAINLHKYHNKTLKIRLVTYDCAQGGHYGYAYFTLGCSDGKIRGLSCANSASNRFEGPDGFKYRWYLEDNPDSIISESKILEVLSNDTLTYNLDVIQPTNENCFYTLQASAVARWPEADIAYSQSVADCKNSVKFENKSYVRRENQVTGESVITSEPCESFFWNFGDGTTSMEENPTHVFPEKGGTYTVTFSAGLAGGECHDDTTFILDFPKIGISRDTIKATICEFESYEFNGKYLFNEGFYSDTLVSIYGCDSIEFLDLKVIPKPEDTLIKDTICSDEEYIFDGKLITESGHYEAIFKTEAGCDSVVKLDLVINESLHIDFDSLLVVCADDEKLIIPYTITSGSLNSYEVKIESEMQQYAELEDCTIEDEALVVSMPKDIIPGNYVVNLDFGKKSCGKEGETIPLKVYYPRSIMAQRWNDVLAVKNEEYNGGYEFVSFQWYKNGVVIEGATSSILYLPEGLDLSAEYSVLLTRLSDNVTILSCVADLLDYSGLEEERVIVFSSGDETFNVNASESLNMKIWTATGILIKEVELVAGENTISTLGLSGLYILDCVFKDNHREIKQVVLE